MIDEELLKKISSLLIEKKLTISTAESCTGGLLAHILTNIPGSSNYFDRGFVSYANRAKIELLDIPEILLKKYGAVSRQVAIAMAEGARKKSNVNVGISTTGIVGPTGGSETKPVGLVYIALSTKERTFVRRFKFSGDRLKNKENACNAALEMLYNYLTGDQ